MFIKSIYIYILCNNTDMCRDSSVNSCCVSKQTLHYVTF